MSQSLRHLESFTIDYEEQEFQLVARDGRVIRQRASSWPTSNETLTFKRVSFRPAELLLTMVTPWDQVVEIEVFDNDDQVVRRFGRPVVYLDQNKWVQISCAIHQPERVHAPELAPTRHLIALARSRNIILPISSGHWIETASTHEQRRSRLAAEMVGLSRGWVMRDPLLVRAAELRGLFLNSAGESVRDSANKPVFTLDSIELSARRTRGYVPKTSGLPSELIDLIGRISGVQAAMAVLLENEPTKSPEGVEAARSWALGHQAFAKHLATESATRPHVRALTLSRFISDLGTEVAEAARDGGLTPSDLQSWLASHADRQVSQLPYLGREREVIHRRLVNLQDAWEPNDLIDMLFLPCAAGYADYVVCEKKTGHHLQQVSKLRATTDGAAIFASIRHLVSALDADRRLLSDRSR